MNQSEPINLTVEISDADTVSALIYAAPKRERKNVTIVLGHGAGADQLSGFMRMVSDGLAARGFDAMTFNFLYKEKGKSVPDPKARLESCYRAVIDGALNHKKLKGNKLVIGGKSMGGRIASQVAAAEGERVAGLVFLGYPLHPPGRPDKMRDEHLKEIKAPMLFCQGSRDPFGTEDEIKAIIKKHRLPATLYVIESGDHSFKVPKSVKPQPQVYEDVMDEIAKWCQTI